MRFDLQKINQTDITNRLVYICEQEHVVLEDEQALDYIAKISDGCMRDAIAKLEKVINLSNNVSINSVVSVLGSADYNTYFNIVDCIVDNNSIELLKEINDMSKLSLSIKTICTNMILFVLDLTKYAIFKSTDVLTYIPKIFEEKIKYSTGVRQTQKEVIDYFNNLLQKIYTLKDVQDINTFEIMLLGIMNEVS
jgi:DNA polymerase-3 subunit gamma/tau